MSEQHRLDEIRARHANTMFGENTICKQDRAYLLTLLDRVAAWIEATRHVESLTKHGRQKAEHYKDAANELTAILNTSAKEVTK